MDVFANFIHFDKWDIAGDGDIRKMNANKAGGRRDKGFRFRMHSY